MPAYNFQKQFVPYVKDYSKPHTVRAYRKDGRLPKIGELVHLYTGMRTNQCEKLVNPSPPATDVKTIFITAAGKLYIGPVEKKIFAQSLLTDEFLIFVHCGADLEADAKNTFAWMDGFRPEGTTVNAPGNAFHLMLQWVTQTHGLPFTGTITYWI
jgi:hypothetical protein